MYLLWDGWDFKKLFHVSVDEYYLLLEWDNCSCDPIFCSLRHMLKIFTQVDGNARTTVIFELLKLILSHLLKSCNDLLSKIIFNDLSADSLIWSSFDDVETTWLGKGLVASHLGWSLVSGFVIYPLETFTTLIFTTYLLFLFGVLEVYTPGCSIWRFGIQENRIFFLVKWEEVEVREKV